MDTARHYVWAVYLLVRRAQPGVWEPSSMLPRRLLPDLPARSVWLHSSARVLATAESVRRRRLRLCGPAQTGSNSPFHAGIKRRSDSPTRKVGIETRPFAAIVRHAVKPPPVEEDSFVRIQVSAAHWQATLLALFQGGRPSWPDFLGQCE
jgi:hypothetical protein